MGRASLPAPLVCHRNLRLQRAGLPFLQDKAKEPCSVIVGPSVAACGLQETGSGALDGFICPMP